LALLAGPRFARAAETSPDKKLDFNRDIRPILSENCFQCHGFDEKARQANLRLDQADSAFAEHDSGKPIVPGHPDQSELWRRVTSTDESEIMPPTDSHRALKPEQKETLKRWIEQGAPYAKHWSFIPPMKAELPEVSDKVWPHNEIDRFVLARLDAEKLSHSPEADRRTLIRRLSLDLTGLPPSAAEVETFVADKDPKAYEKLVDRLLASSHFGERMALVWLDAARYADTNGYSIDGGRHMWLWRDWVINAFNTNLPYDQFIRDQLAGDLIPNHTEAQLVATGFQRNNMNTHEGGTIPEENLTNYNVDRVKTFGESMLGLTLGCCQCHDHKFDPLTQKDYYQIYAYFNTLSDVGLDGDRGIDSRPSIEAKTVLQTGEEPELEKQIAALKDKLAHPPDRQIEQWIRNQRLRLSARGKDFKLHPVDLLKVSTPNTGAGFDIDPPRFVLISSPAALVAYDVSMHLPKLDKPMTGVRVVFHPDPKAPGGGRGYGNIAVGPPSRGGPRRRTKLQGSAARLAAPTRGTFILTAFSASADPVAGDNINLNRLLGMASVTADSWLPAWRPEGVIDTRGNDGWSPEDGDGPAHITVTFDKPVDTVATPFMTIQLNFGHVDSTVAARFEFLAMTGTDDGSDLPQEIIDIITKGVARPESARGVVESQTTTPFAEPQGVPPNDLVVLRQYFSDHSDFTKRDRIALANLQERLDAITKKVPSMVMDVSPQPRETHILNRGDYAQPKEKVNPGTPAILPPLPSAPGSAGGPSTRLDLAHWMTMRDHPLTARVEVNRLWQIFFGTGLVATPADFGNQGQYPSHPELLDWLAVDFMDHGWDVKRMIKNIVMSSTYRQSSDTGVARHEYANGVAAPGQTTPFAEPQGVPPRVDLLARDPQNRLLARGPRFRLPAEFIRDESLKVSGLLVDRLGGPSVNPYTPGNLWREISHYGSTPATSQTFEQDHGEKLYRRSLYTYWKRTVPPPNMVAFDAPNRELCTVARPSTTTPMQALVLLNDTQFVEAARAFAERAINQPGDDPARLRWAFEECVSREPTDAELAVLTSALHRERARYLNNPTAATEYLANGESFRNEEIPAPEHAAWSQVAALILNLSETVTRN
jgi:hypothetical protein